MKPSKTQWFKAARSWDCASIRSILNGAPELLQATDAKGLNALHMACAAKPRSNGGHEPNGLKTLAAVLNEGIDVDSVAFTDHDGGEWCANAVWFATARGQNLPLVKLLLKRGGDPGYSLFAVLWGYKPEFARELVKYKPRMNLLKMSTFRHESRFDDCDSKSAEVYPCGFESPLRHSFQRTPAPFLSL